MKIDIQGKHIYRYSKEEIYSCILGLPELVKSFPVVENVERQNNDSYIFTFGINFGMYTGSYSGHLHVVEKNENNYLHLRATHQSRLGKLFIEVHVRIKEFTPDKNILFIDGFFDVRGMMRFAGGRVLKSGVSTGLEIMFDFLEGRLAESRKLS